MQEQEHETRSSIEQLQNDAQSVPPVVDLIRQEADLFRRLMYKNHNQHRRAPYYHSLQLVKRCLRDLPLKQVRSAFIEANSLLTDLTVEEGMHHISWKRLSTDLVTKTDSVLKHLVSISLQATEIIQAIRKAYKGLVSQFAQTYFMPFTLMMNAILARLKTLFQNILVLSIELHGGISLLYLHEVTKSNPLRAKVTSTQLQGYQLPAIVLTIANT